MIYMTAPEYISLQLINTKAANSKIVGNDDNVTFGLLRTFSEKLIDFGVSDRDILYKMDQYKKDSMDFYILKQALNYIRSSDDDKKSLFKPWEDK